MSVIESTALSSAIAALHRRRRRLSPKRPLDSSNADLNPRLFKMPKPSPSRDTSTSTLTSSTPSANNFSSTLPSSPPTVHFFVRIMSRTIAFDSKLNETISSLISRIKKTTGIATSDLHLIYSGRQLDNDSTLAELNIKNDDLLHLTGRLRSTRFPLSWQIADDLIAAVHSLIDGRGMEISKIARLLKQFLTFSATMEEDEIWHHLEVFLLAGAPAVLVKLYLDPINRSLAFNSISLFLDFESDPYLKEIRFQIAPIVLEFCKLLAGTAGKWDPLYLFCRKTLASMLEAEGLDHLRSANVIHELFPFVSELFELILEDSSCDSAIVTSDVVREFSRFLDAMRRAIENWVGVPGPIPKSLFNNKIRCYEDWIGALHAMFLKFMTLIEEHLKKAKELSSHKRSNVLVVLTLCNSFAKIYEGAETLLHQFLLAQRGPLNFLLRHAKRNEDLIWILKYKDVTDFNARKNVVLMMFHEATEEDNLYEMLIDRMQLLVESFEYIGKAKAKALRGGLFMEFKNEEATGPGVLREWFCLLCREIFDPKKVLFLPCPNDHRRFFPNPTSVVDPLHRDYYGFCGRVIALALMHKVQVGIMFDRVFFLQLAGKSVTLEDIQYADPCLYMSCKRILEMDADLLDSDALGLTFVTEVGEVGSRRAIELCHRGKNIVVKSSNREKYVDLLIQHRFVRSISKQLAYFAKGFADILSNAKNEKLFFQSLDVEDFDRMLGGNDNIISMTDWKAHTEYNGYKATDRPISWFWKIVEGMSTEQQRMLLFFWTSVKYLPLGGFSGLTSKLYIYKTSDSKGCLPMSHTCFYRLCLPAYKSKLVMQERLLLITQEHVSCTFGLW